MQYNKRNEGNNMAIIKGVFFDLDGTLVDTHDANYQAYKAAIAKQGRIIDFEGFRQTIGMQAQDFLPMLAPGLSAGQYQSIATDKARFYKELIHATVPNRALIDFLKYISVHHIVVLVTTAKRANATAVLGHHGLDDIFTAIVTAEDVSQSKPSPEAYLLALNLVGLNADEVIAFEDSETGIQAAQAANIAVMKIRDFIV